MPNPNNSTNPHFRRVNWQPRPATAQLTTRRAAGIYLSQACGGSNCRPCSGENRMLWTITIILFILWLLGMVSSYTLGGWIHILLVLAVIMLIFNLLSGRRAA